jgi:hypothetical protein
MGKWQLLIADMNSEFANFTNADLFISELRHDQYRNHRTASMKFRMDKIVRELVEEAWEWARLGRDREFVDRDRVFAEAICELETQGDAMRYVNSKGQIAWKATPNLRDYLNYLKLDAEADLEDEEV